MNRHHIRLCINTADRNMFLEREKMNVEIPLVVFWFMTPYSLGWLPMFCGNLMFSISSSTSNFKMETTNILQTLVTTHDLRGVITQISKFELS
jgi:hypothetical protein